MNILNQEEIKVLCKKYKSGMRVELLKMDDPYTTLKPGDQGTISTVDDIGNIHVEWDSGSTLAVILDVDEIKIIK